MVEQVKVRLNQRKDNFKMKKIIIILIIFITACATPKECCSQIKKAFKFSTFYIAANGGTSLADRDIYSTNQGVLSYDTVFTIRR